MKTIAIIGGGFSGTMTAVNLTRLSDEPLHVVIINSHRPTGRGVAYGATRGEHLLNVAARNMSAFPDIPSHFLEWLRSRCEYRDMPEDELRHMFAPRRVYGDYLSSLLTACLHPIDIRSETTVRAIEDEAIDVAVDSNGSATVMLKGGATVDADKVVLATGNQPPGKFPSPAPLRHDARYCGDPWDQWAGRLPPAGGRIVLLGTGLTMVDVVLTLNAIGWEGEIVAVSRNGMLPKSHFRGVAYEDYLPENADTLGLNGLFALVQKHCGRLTQMSQNPAIAIDKLRPHTQRLWRALSDDEKREFLSKHSANWNVTRHRIAVSIHDEVTDALDSGRLRIVTGSINQLLPHDEGIEVQAEGPDGESISETGDLVINCTGPQSCFSKTNLPLFDNLLQKGLVVTDSLDMGVEVDDQFAARTPAGDSSRTIYAMGPLLKGSLWETTAVPELRGQAMRVAEALLQREPAPVQEEAVIEYYI